MSSHNMSKISRKTLFDYVQIWRKGVSTSFQCSDQIVKQSRTKSDITPESSYDSYIRKSPSRICIEQNASRQKDAQGERLYENDLAALKQSRSSSILRDYHLNQRWKQTADEESPKKPSQMVVKLNEIMSLNVATSELEDEERFNDKYYFENISQCMDFKPQANTNANRWYIKLPQNYENKESVSRQDVQGRPEKLRKLVELPRISGERRKPSICSISNEENEFMQKCKPQEIWQFGSVIVPRLEL